MFSGCRGSRGPDGWHDRGGWVRKVEEGCIGRLCVRLDGLVEIVAPVEDACAGADEAGAFAVASPLGHCLGRSKDLQSGIVGAVKAVWFEGRWLLRQGHGGSFCWGVWDGYAMEDASRRGWSLGAFREKRFCAPAAAWFRLARHMKFHMARSMASQRAIQLQWLKKSAMQDA